MNIILLAPPAAGKGTQSEKLEKHYHLSHISTGDLLREELKKETPLAKELQTIMSSGQLVSDDIVLKLIENTLAHTQQGHILDGFPRTLNQAQKCDQLLSKMGQKIDYVLCLDADFEILKKRIVGRLLCKECGSIYNEYFDITKPKVEGICDKCKSPLTKRSDDNEESFDQRYHLYLKETEPLIDYYQKQGILYHIPFCDTPDKVFEEIKKVVGDTND